MFPSPSLAVRLPRPLRVSLSQVEDRRAFHPLSSWRPARLLSGHPAPPVVPKSAPPGRSFRGRFPFHGLRFAVPERVVICVRRHERREVMFAKKRAGKRGQRKPRRNWYSAISCKR